MATLVNNSPELSSGIALSKTEKEVVVEQHVVKLEADHRDDAELEIQQDAGMNAGDKVSSVWERDDDMVMSDCNANLVDEFLGDHLDGACVQNGADFYNDVKQNVTKLLRFLCVEDTPLQEVTGEVPMQLKAAVDPPSSSVDTPVSAAPVIIVAKKAAADTPSSDQAYKVALVVEREASQKARLRELATRMRIELLQRVIEREEDKRQKEAEVLAKEAAFAKLVDEELVKELAEERKAVEMKYKEEAQAKAELLLKQEEAHHKADVERIKRQEHQQGKRRLRQEQLQAKAIEAAKLKAEKEAKKAAKIREKKERKQAVNIKKTKKKVHKELKKQVLAKQTMKRLEEEPTWDDLKSLNQSASWLMQRKKPISEVDLYSRVGRSSQLDKVSKQISQQAATLLKEPGNDKNGANFN